MYHSFVYFSCWSIFCTPVAYIHTLADLEIRFKEKSYIVNEEEGFVTIEVEVKNNVTSEMPIYFTVTFTDGNAISEFYTGLGYDKLDIFILLC